MTGPLDGTTVELVGDRLTIGRQSTSDFRIPDLSVSREHCALERAGDDWILRDVASAYGVRVNSVRVSEKRLEHGDRVSLGSSDLLFLDGRDDSETPGTQLDERDTYHPSAELNLGGELFRRPDQLLDSFVGEPALGVLLRAGIGLGTQPDLGSLADHLLELALDAIPAERAVLRLVNHGDEPRTFVRRNRPGLHAETPERVSATVTGRSLEEQVAILASLVSSEGELAEAPSLVDSAICSLVCSPLIDGSSKARGVLYLESHDPDRPLDESHLRIAAALAGLAAVAITNLRHQEWLETERRRLYAHELDHDLIGESEPIVRLIAELAKVSRVDSTVLLRGESGTGKELAAQAIHRGSERAERPFVAINCACLSEMLLESEIFGHEKGAFTGAHALKRGKIEVANGGTLFLDEVGELPLAVQAKLLRVLQEREFERLGGTASLAVDVRILAATNRDLERAIEKGEFRRDLFFRLNVIPITLPPLRERGDDVLSLAHYFCQLHGRHLSRRIDGFSDAAREVLVSYPWPGNVRELSNAIERAVVLGEGGQIELHDLPEELRDAAAPSGNNGDFHEDVREAKRRLLRKALRAADGNYPEAARRLGLNPTYLHRLTRNLGLKDETD